jgi:G protein-coupled receptor kinase interacting protein 2
MVQSLYSCGSNSIWEYSLLNPGAGSTGATGSGSSKGDRRKPSASDPLHPIKGDFINAKYQQLAFVYRPSTSSKDEPPPSESELSRQLHSSVRTPNLETSLRLLSQGADPNYYHPEKNSTPLQVIRLIRTD